MDMLDDDIVYLGSRNPQSPSTARPSSQSPLTGIVLHVEKCGSVEPQKLTFNKKDMAVVQIGRRSGFDPDRLRSSDIEQEGAMFRCAVVSRKHAKIALSDSGAAYLIDLNSHHGTHVRHSDEKYSKAIAAETPTILLDGDVVTFGKTVGKNEEAVHPVIVKVELVYQSNSPSSSKPFVITTPTVSPSLSHTTVPKSSGRYGVHDTSSSSSDNESYSSGMYSDVDDVSSSPPPHPAAAAPPTGGPSSAPMEAQTGAISLAPMASQSSVVEPKGKRPFNSVNLPSVADIMQRIFRPAPPSLFGRFSQPSQIDVGESHPIGFDASQHDIYEPDSPPPFLCGTIMKSRSTSPMDLASNSPSPAPEVIVSRQLSIPPVFTPTPRRPITIDLSTVDGPSNAVEDILAEAASLYKAPEINLAELYDLPGIISPAGPSVQSTSASTKEPETKPSGDLSDQIKDIRDSMARLEEEVVKLNNHRKKYKARFSSNTQFMNQKLGEFYDKVDEANAECTMLYDKVDAIRSVEIPDIQAQVDMLEERMDKYDGVGEESDDDFYVDEEDEAVGAQPAETEDDVELRTGAEKVRALIDELVLLRDTAKKDFAAELESIQMMRHVALADIEKAKAELAAQTLKFADQQRTSPSPISFRPGRTTPVPPSLKRKRDDTDENEDRDDAGETREGDGSSVMSERRDENGEPRVIHFDLESDWCGTSDAMVGVVEKCSQLVIPDTPPPRKRARRVVSVVAQTATAVTIGAVVTWTALAFS